MPELSTSDEQGVDVLKQQRKGGRFDGTLKQVALIYTGLMILWLLAFLLPVGDKLLLQGAAIFGSWFYLPVWFLLAAAIVKRRPRLVLILLIPVLFFAYDYGHLFLPRWPTLHAAQENKQSLRVMSWNGYFRNHDSAAFLTALQEIQPDILAIQEWSNGLEQTVDPMVTAIFPYQERYPTGTAAGMALFSRYPILQSTVPDFRDRDSCNCLEATVDVHGQTITLMSAHPWPPQLQWRNNDRWTVLADLNTTGQDETFDALLQRIAEAPRPLLLLGDFNTTERQRNYKRVKAVLTDAFAEAGWGMGYTFPTVKRIYGIPVFPVLRLDYIFHDQHWHTQRIWRGTIEGSDHRYLVADLVLAE